MDKISTRDFLKYAGGIAAFAGMQGSLFWGLARASPRDRVADWLSATVEVETPHDVYTVKIPEKGDTGKVRMKTSLADYSLSRWDLGNTLNGEGERVALYDSADGAVAAQPDLADVAYYTLKGAALYDRLVEADASSLQASVTGKHGNWGGPTLHSRAYTPDEVEELLDKPYNQALEEIENGLALV